MSLLPALACCAQQANAPPSDLPVVSGTRICGGIYEADTPGNCREIDANRAQAIFDYIGLLSEQGWKLKTDQAASAGETIWFERAKWPCPEVLHVQVLLADDGVNRLYFQETPACSATPSNS